MIQMTKEYLENANNITKIVNDVKAVLDHRYKMYQRYQKKNGIPLEAYTTKVATGYMAGTQPKFTIKQENNENKQNIIKKIFDKVFGDNANPDEYKIIVDYINDYNDLSDFFLNICLDYFSTGACTWLNYENEENEQIFARVPSWQCALIYDYSVPSQVIGAVRIFNTIDASGNKIDNVIITTTESKRYFKNSAQQKDVYVEDTEQKEDVLWQLVPVYGVESNTGALFENVLDLIGKLEQCIQNTSNIMNYNDLGCKLKITGYRPQNPSTIKDEKGNVVSNPDRKKEDDIVLNATVFYTPDSSGDISWISKTIDTQAVETLKTTLLEYILMLTFIPNITDEGFTNADSNKALMKKFFGLQTSQQETIKALKKELLRMWENIIGRINDKKNTKFDFRDLDIQIQANIPTDDNEVVDMWLKLQDLLSDETILSNLPLDIDVESELAKKKEENEEKMQEFYNKNAKNVDNNLKNGQQDGQQNNNNANKKEVINNEEKTKKEIEQE